MKFIDFFSGVGGFRLGMEMAGHECVGHCECDPFCNKCKEYTLHKNHPLKHDYSICTVCGTEKKQHAQASYYAMHQPKKGEFHATDIRGVEPGDLPEADVYCAGFPCQSFSIAGKRGGFADTRGTLFFEVMRLAVVRKPKYLFLENVKGLLSHDGGKTFGTILESLWECGYDAEWQVCNSKNYGVPQNRERVFIVGHIRNGSRWQVFPIGNANAEIDDSRINQIGNLCADSKRDNPEVGRVYGTDGISPCLNTMGGGQREPKIAVSTIGNLNTSGNGMNGEVYDSNGLAPTRTTNKGDGNKIAIPVLTPDRPEKRQNGRRFKEDGEEMFTITAQDRHGVVVGDPRILRKSRTEYGKAIRKQYENGEIEERRCNMTKLEPREDGISNTISTVEKDNYLIDKNLTIRKLTPKECFRLQGFPDEYFERAASVNSDSQLYKQSGNSVTVNVIHEIAKRLKDD